ncbi:MAG: acyl--CoA ligase [Lachnospiraceae bacterium]|nr:acyl--CoA ligase [Lachnospiraceae bacterium]MBQ8328189.1 acyl--CoA ligase [Lachnospiraceae bacterium]
MKTKAFPPKYNSFTEVLRSFSQIDPDRPLLIYEEGGAPVKKSRADFAASVLARAEEMRTFGMTCLGVLCDGSLDCVETIFASAVAGLQTVLLDENADDTLLQEQIKQTDIDILWSSDPDLVEELTPYLTDGITPRTESRDSSVEGSDILFFTSGTTASSKAVVLTDRSLLAAAYNGSCMLPLSPDDTLLCMLPLNHVFGFVCGLLWGMECGSAVALGRGARYYTQDFEFYKPTVLSAVPLLLSFLVQHKLMNSELRLVLVGAGDCSPLLLNSAVQQGVQISFGYGLTETSSGVAISVPGSSSFDPFALQICPEDTVALASDGEILISSPSCMMKGYYKHPEDTAAVLKGNLLFTGDIGKWDENGRLHVIGRKKEILVLADGTKIFLPEYEARIMAALPGRDFTVLERDGKPVLLLVDKESSTWPEEMRELSRSMVQEELRGAMSQLPRGQQLSEILFTDQPLPRTATGKVKRWEITSP